MITEIAGIRVGHFSDSVHQTGCTVILCPEGSIGGVDVRGPAPGTRETVILGATKRVESIHGILLTGGSAFGLAAADGVMRYLEEQKIGHPTPMALIPIVPAAVVYDLFLGGGKRRPDAQMGYDACLAATDGAYETGRVGAGSGVTVGKWAGFERMMYGGVGSALLRQTVAGQELLVGALAVVNSVGDIIGADGKVLAGAKEADGRWLAEIEPYCWRPFAAPPPGANTTLVLLATNARFNKVEVNRLAERAHDGMAMSIYPVHSSHDGDTAFALATNQVDAPYDLVANMGVKAVAAAIRSSVV